MTPFDYQIRFTETMETILSFTMHEDTIGFKYNDPMLCGVKTYSTELPWLSVYKPVDPLNQSFELRIKTND
jgi:hypothetical protein